MRRPWTEATALLAAHGFACTPPPPLKGLIPMSAEIRFAFLARIDAVARPTVFQTLDRLAAHIEGQRFGQAIQLEEIAELRRRRAMATGQADAAPDGRRDRGVQIWTLLLDGSRDRSLGFAWLDGQGRETLQGALERAAFQKAAAA